MAGHEQLEVHSKSYIVRWLKVEDGQSIAWTVQPHKKSMYLFFPPSPFCFHTVADKLPLPHSNFGIVKHPGTGATNIVPSQSDDPATPSGVTSGVNDAKPARFAKKDTITAQDQLASKGFIPIEWQGRCEAETQTTGTHDVLKGQAGMYGLVFDNTFSKQTSKTVTLSLRTYPIGSPPPTAHNVPNLSLGNPAKSGSKTSLGKHGSPHMNAVASDSQDSLHSHVLGGRPTSVSGRSDGAANYHVGNLLKRRRKKGQGYARRFFSLDYSSCTLSYFYNRNSSALRGAIPLSLAAIAADERRREINIDSGAEIWHLKASNVKEFGEWARALEKAVRIARGFEPVEGQTSKERGTTTPLRIATGLSRTATHNPLEDREWEQVESLVSRTVGTRDALRRLVKDMSNTPRPAHSSGSQYLSPGGSSVQSEEREGYFPSENQKRPFWKRKSSIVSPQSFQPMISSSLAVPSPGSANPRQSTNGSNHARKKSRGVAQEEKSMQDHCGALLNDLDSVVAEFTLLIANSKRRRLPAPLSAAASRLSMDTTSTDEFFDAEVGETGSQIVRIDRSEEDDAVESDADEAELHDSSSAASTIADEDTGGLDEESCYPSKPKSLTPLPVDISVERRSKIPPGLIQPPSLIGIVRKNVGKDLSNISAPVSANEPTSMLQRIAEQLEYSQLLDAAVQQKTAKDRLLYVTAFAVSQISINRSKERAIRKPFNPLLGETYELLRTEQEVPGGFRLIAEKRRNHHGGSRANSLRLMDGTDELYSWTHAAMFLRNVVMGEKYVEPVGTMHVNNDTTGAKAVVEFRSKGGMFGGRGEDVVVETYTSDGSNSGTGLIGTWTTGLRRTENGKAVGDDVWKVGKLVDNAATTYGLTQFAAQLNEITEIEKGRLPPTDSRLRPDQRQAELGDLDAAEETKVVLEEEQRARRKDLEERGEEHKPKWFVKLGNGPEGEEVWKIKTGKDSYWEERTRGTWNGVTNIFAVYR
ncbi:oxysterol-binding protein [Verticillium alfalfae VaMs.102]|uniref:Oxysterol-binding protein n=1 Tax=Verticillium alfalfae (strain VaMs.102 / ATCC MYA-4576 / FGSC 10136) TaxID=526221 RepID=C9S6C4_VERA1|nr:oxysterol-binding protein [Verticillium alfalfae VaMs.102]EEY14436.1 oxysterol-binding protein [Verticillium alfalfae VaMs.102]